MAGPKGPALADRCRPGPFGPGGGLAVARRSARVRRRGRPAGARGVVRGGPGPAGASVTRSRGSGVHDSRTRSDAPRDAALHVASPAVRGQAPARRLCQQGGPHKVRPTTASAGMGGGSRLAASRWGPTAKIWSSAGTTSCRVDGADVDGFSIERYNVTNAQFLEFVEAGGYGDARWWRAEDWKWVQSEQRLASPVLGGRGGQATGRTSREREWYWRGMFERIPLPPAWPVYVSYAEAAAYARWRGARLMTEAEYQRAAYGVTGRFARWRTSVPVGKRQPVAGARRVRFFELGSRARRQPSQRKERLGRGRPRR